MKREFMCQVSFSAKSFPGNHVISKQKEVDHDELHRYGMVFRTVLDYFVYAQTAFHYLSDAQFLP